MRNVKTVMPTSHGLRLNQQDGKDIEVLSVKQIANRIESMEVVIVDMCQHEANARSQNMHRINYEMKRDVSRDVLQHL